MDSKRYSRQTILPEIGENGQEQLRKSRVLCVGVGGLGSPTSLYLAAAGVGTIGLIDPDQVDESNLQRQVLYKTFDQGKNKTDLAKQRLLELNPTIEILSISDSLNAQNAEMILSHYDLVIDGSDNFETKFLINDACYKIGIPFVYGAIQGFEGEVGIFDSRHDSCYRCLYPELPKAIIQNCDENGILGSIAGVIGSLQATLALQYLVSKNSPGHPLEPAWGEITKFDFRGGLSSRNFRVHKSENCRICMKDPSEVQLLDGILETPSIELQTLIDWIENKESDLLILDVREENEWKQGYLPHAHHWPLWKLEKGIVPEIIHHNQKIVAYCHSGARARIATDILIRQGYQNTYQLNAGIARALSAIQFLR
jgi:adenylyltransferase/sulfurtransferase